MAYLFRGEGIREVKFGSTGKVRNKSELLGVGPCGTAVRQSRRTTAGAILTLAQPLDAELIYGPKRVMLSVLGLV